MVNERPQLFAFVICENVVMDGDIPILYRLVDTFNFEFTTSGVPEGTFEKFPVGLRCKIFIRWGPPGKGKYTESLALITPEGNEVNRQDEDMVIQEGFHFTQRVQDVSLSLVNPGLYKWALYLDNEKIAELPFMVNITRAPMPST